MNVAESTVASIRRRLVPIRPEGVPFVAILVFVALFFGWFWQPILWLGLILAAWFAYFFRDPPRVTPTEDGLVLAPADGQVSAVSLGVAPKELGLGEQMRRRISILPGALDCHLSRAPAGGAVRKVTFHPGSLVGAATEERARSGMVIESPSGPIGVIQTAGFLGRRIVSLSAEGETLAAGQRIAVLPLGAQVDIYVPVAATVIVAEGQTSVAGETPVARFDGGGATARRSVRID